MFCKRVAFRLLKYAVQKWVGRHETGPESEGGKMLTCKLEQQQNRHPVDAPTISVL